MGDDFLRIGPSKVLSDGSLIGRSAFMCCDYDLDEGNRGFFQFPEGTLRERLIGAHLAGWQLAVHAIGDAALDLVMDIFEQAQELDPRPDARHRIEHASVASDEQIARMASLGLIPVPQGRFIHELGDGVIRAMGEERAEIAYRVKGFLDAGIELPASTDAPVVDANPILNIASLVNRTTATGRTLGRRNGSPWPRPCAPTRWAAPTRFTRIPTREPWTTATSPTSSCFPMTSSKSPWKTSPRHRDRHRGRRRPGRGLLLGPACLPLPHAGPDRQVMLSVIYFYFICISQHGLRCMRHPRRLGRPHFLLFPASNLRSTTLSKPIHAGAAIVESLALHGVERVFAVPGESYLAVLDGLHDADIETVVCRQEGGAAYMAEAHGKFTGKPGVAMVTRGPGAANAYVAIHSAWQDGTPMVMFVGLIPVADRMRESFQEFDPHAWFGTQAKRVFVLDEAERASEIVAEAFFAASSGRPGPVIIGLPEDVITHEFTGTSTDPSPSPKAPCRRGNWN